MALLFLCHKRADLQPRRWLTKVPITRLMHLQYLPTLIPRRYHPLQQRSYVERPECTILELLCFRDCVERYSIETHFLTPTLFVPWPSLDIAFIARRNAMCRVEERSEVSNDVITLLHHMLSLLETNITISHSVDL